MEEKPRKFYIQDCQIIALVELLLNILCVEIVFKLFSFSSEA